MAMTKEQIEDLRKEIYDFTCSNVYFESWKQLAFYMAMKQTHGLFGDLSVNDAKFDCFAVAEYLTLRATEDKKAETIIRKHLELIKRMDEIDSELGKLLIECKQDYI